MGRGWKKKLLDCIAKHEESYAKGKDYTSANTIAEMIPRFESEIDEVYKVLFGHAN